MERRAFGTALILGLRHAMIIERSMHPEWLSNAYLVADEPGGHGVVIDSGGPSAPLLAKIEEHGVTVSHLLLTHHHADHVAENGVYKERFGVEVLAHPVEARGAHRRRSHDRARRQRARGGRPGRSARC